MSSPHSESAATTARPPAAERRDQILGAAREVCLAHGIAAARMDDIAARARVSKGTLYNHFANREDLLLAMMEERLQLGTEVVADALGNETEPGAALARTLEGLVAMIAVQAETAPLLYQAWGLVGDDAMLRERLYSALRRFFAEWRDSIREVLRAGQASGAFRPEADADAFTETLIALVSGLIFRGSFDPVHVHPERLRMAFRTLVADRLLEPPERPGDPPSAPEGTE